MMRGWLKNVVVPACERISLLVTFDSQRELNSDISMTVDVERASETIVSVCGRK